MAPQAAPGESLAPDTQHPDSTQHIPRAQWAVGLKEPVVALGVPRTSPFLALPSPGAEGRGQPGVVAQVQEDGQDFLSYSNGGARGEEGEGTASGPSHWVTGGFLSGTGGTQV